MFQLTNVFLKPLLRSVLPLFVMSRAILSVPSWASELPTLARVTDAKSYQVKSKAHPPLALANHRFCPKGEKVEQLDLTGVKLARPIDIPLMYKGFNNIEGPVWHDGALYYSNIGSRELGEAQPALTNLSTIWRWRAGSAPEVWLGEAQAGSNGLAINFAGELVVAKQLDGTVVQVDWTSKQSTLLAANYKGRRFNSPNDLAIAHDGRLYFTDPNWNTPSNVDPNTVQGGGVAGDLAPGQRVYRLDPDGSVHVLAVTKLVPALRDKPNGIVLSLNEKKLLVGGLRGLWVFNLRHGRVSRPKQIMITPVDGMGKDCAGNIYVTTTRPLISREDGQVVVVLDKKFREIGVLVVPRGQGVTNVAFGGDDGRTLFVTSFGRGVADSGTPSMCGADPCLPAGIYAARLNVRGFPY